MNKKIEFALHLMAWVIIFLTPMMMSGRAGFQYHTILVLQRSTDNIGYCVLRQLLCPRAKILFLRKTVVVLRVQRCHHTYAELRNTTVDNALHELLRHSTRKST